MSGSVGIDGGGGGGGGRRDGIGGGGGGGGMVSTTSTRSQSCARLLRRAGAQARLGERGPEGLGSVETQPWRSTATFARENLVDEWLLKLSVSGFLHNNLSRAVST